MFRRIWNIFISFFIIFQGFRGQNPNYRRGNVKGLGWLHDLDEQGVYDKDCLWSIIVLNFEFLLVWIMMMWLMLQPHFEGVWGWHSHPEMGTWESSGTPENSEFHCRGQNTLPWGVLYTIGKFLKCRCRKWPRMSHLDICSTSYVWKKGQKSNLQFDSRPL
jgi:hypothetical protein